MACAYRTVNIKATAAKIRAATKNSEALKLLAANRLREAAKASGVKLIYHELWRGRYKDRFGEWKHFTGTDNKADTLEDAREYERKERRIRDNIDRAPTKADRHHSFEAVAAKYREWGESFGGLAHKGWSKDHRYNIGKRLTYWQDELRIDEIKQIERGHVERILARLLQSGKSIKTVDGYRETICAFCNWAVKNQFLAVDPLTGVDRLHGALDPEPKTTPRGFTDEELKKLIEVAPADRRLWYHVALATGYRANECSNLKVQDLDLEGCTLPLAAEFTKNRKAARQPIPKVLAEALKKSAEGRAPTESLLKMPGKRQIGVHFRFDCTQAGIFNRDDGCVTFHSFRKTFCTEVVNGAGTDLKTIVELTRHHSADFTIKRYARKDTGKIRAAADRVAKKLVFTPPSRMGVERKAAGAEGMCLNPDANEGSRRKGNLGIPTSNPRDGSISKT